MKVVGFEDDPEVDLNAEMARLCIKAVTASTLVGFCNFSVTMALRAAIFVASKTNLLVTQLLFSIMASGDSGRSHRGKTVAEMNSGDGTY